jgi:6-phosphogluconolactonase
VNPHPLRIILNKKEVLIFNDIHEISGFFLDEWQRLSDDAIKRNAEFTVALSGGRTPVRVYEKLAGLSDYPYWDKSHLFLVDERFVPLQHPESNYGLLRKTLLDHVDIPKRNIHHIPTDEGSPQKSARIYEDDILSHFKINADELPMFNLILLGIGEDGHTASLFPGTHSVSVEKRLAIAVSPPQPFRFERITITLPVINNAENVIFIVTGENKARVLKSVIMEQDKRLPASLVRPVNGRLMFLIDEPSARQLS